MYENACVNTACILVYLIQAVVKQDYVQFVSILQDVLDYIFAKVFQRFPNNIAWRKNSLALPFHCPCQDGKDGRA